MATQTNGVNGSIPEGVQSSGEERAPSRKRARERTQPKINFISPARTRTKDAPPHERVEPPHPERDAKTPKDRNALERALDTQSMPGAVRRRYVQDGKKYYLPSGERAFVDHGARLTTRSENTTIVRDLVAVAAARGWNELTIGGTQEFRREAWREARLAGLSVVGYNPSRTEQALLIDILTREEKPKQSDASVERGAAESRARRVSRRDDPDLIVGKLVKHGAAPFKHDPNNEKSYYVLLKTRRGQREVWGVDLERAMRQSLTDMQPGDEIGLRNVSRSHFTKQTHITDENGRRVSAEVPAHRNGWIAEQKRFFDDRAEFARIFRDTTLKPSEATRKHPELKGSYLKLQEAKLRIDKATKNPEDRAKFVAQVREEMAVAMHRGDPLTPVRMRERAPIRNPELPAKAPGIPDPEHLLAR